MGDETQLDEIAIAQHGVVTWEQAKAAGIRKPSLRRLSRLFPGVYARRSPAFEQRVMAACLWADGVASHRTAARFYALDGFEKAPVDVSVSKGRHLRPRGVHLHRTQLSPEDITRWRNIPVTSPFRTLIDLASCVDLVTLAKAVESAWRLGLVQPLAMKRHLSQQQRRGRKGLKALHRVVRDCLTRPKPLDSPLEVEFWWLLKRARLRLPTPGYEVRDDWGQPMRIDFAYVNERVAIELNGRKAHGPARFEHDNVRSSRIGASHWYMLLFTSAQLENPDQVLGLVADTLTPAEPGKVTIYDSFIGPPL